MQLFYNPSLTIDSQHITLDKVESKHMIRVLRKKTGDTVLLINGKGLLFTAELTVASEKHCELVIHSYEQKPSPSYTLHIAIAPTKNNDRFEWFLEKATEIGIHEITPLLCDRSERRIIKIDRFERILESALKQSLNFYMPKLNPLTAFDEFIKNHQGCNHFIAHCEDDAKSALSKEIKREQDMVICIGPEGDFTPAEISLAMQSSYQPVSLGNNRLRTETAGIVAAHTIALKNE
ncbi:16S rRNA (uracil(1498)-N(3))-methyltransferase [Flavobacteriaceae bacterium F08102]|nr:16S rRNA (uracil(1498)-N(3))-methyltransferase [Flavobacteriaceae bacterium F08102]